MKRITLLTIALLLALSSLTALASTTPSDLNVTPFYTYTDSVDGRLAIASDGTANCSGEVMPISGTYTASVTVTLQQKNGSWIAIASWSGSDYVTGTKKVTAGYSYRVVVSGVVKNAQGVVLERPTITTPEKSY